MTGERTCPECGAALPPAARFCPTCGARQATAGPARATPVDPGDALWSAPAPTEVPRPGRATTEEEQVRARGAEPPRRDGSRPGRATTEERQVRAPGAELPPERVRDPGVARPGELAARLTAPGVARPVLVAALALAATFLVALLVAAIFPDEESVIGSLGDGAGLVTEALRLTVAFLQVGSSGEPAPGVGFALRATPLLLLAVPVGACALAARRLIGPAGAARGATVGVPFALLALVPALAAGELAPGAGATLLAGLVWGALGGALGTRRGRLPRPARAVLAPLAAALAFTGVLGAAFWAVQGARDAGDLVGPGGSTALTIAETTLFAGEHAVHLAQLGTGVEFATQANPISRLDASDTGERTSTLPLAVDDPDVLIGRAGETFRVFDLRDALPAAVFAPGLIVLVLGLGAVALYAGFVLARAMRPPSQPLAGAWGAATGSVWAVALTALSALAADRLTLDGAGAPVTIGLLGAPQGASTFWSVLLFGTVLGALGGILAKQPEP